MSVCKNVKKWGCGFYGIIKAIEPGAGRSQPTKHYKHGNFVSLSKKDGRCICQITKPNATSFSMKRFVMYAALAADLMNGSDAFGASPVLESETANPIELGYK